MNPPAEPEMERLPNGDVPQPARDNQQSASSSTLPLSPTKDVNGAIICTRIYVKKILLRVEELGFFFDAGRTGAGNKKLAFCRALGMKINNLYDKC
jgi:hypothetical protein